MSYYTVSFIPLLFLSCQSNPAKTEQEATSLPNDIWTIYHDQNDNYWFGSNGSGIYRYDGTRLQQFTTKDGLVDNAIRGFQEDKAGKLYIETPSGISQFNGTKFTTLQRAPVLDSAWQLQPDDLWFRCNGNLTDIYRYDGQYLHELQLPRQDLTTAFGIVEEDRRYNPYAVYGIHKDRAGNLWIGTAEAGAFRYDGQSFLWIDDPLLSVQPDGRVPGVRGMLEGTDGRMWLSHFDSRYQIDSTAEKGYRILPGIDQELPYEMLPFFNSGLVDTNGHLWMTTYSDAVWMYDEDKLHRILVGEEGDSLKTVCIYQDRQGVIWLGTENDGVYHWNGKSLIAGLPSFTF